eukprot:13633616-Alexandrium_andersonii.AAC.1
MRKASSRFAVAKTAFVLGGPPVRCLDHGKESARVIARRRASGSAFYIIGVEFDCQLLMRDAVRALSLIHI